MAETTEHGSPQEVYSKEVYDSVMGKHQAVKDAVNKVLSTGMDELFIPKRKEFFRMLDTELQGVLDKIKELGI